MTHAFLQAPFEASNQQCAKVAYPSRREAMRILKRHGPPRATVMHGGDDGGKMGVFHCKTCGLYHLGHR